MNQQATLCARVAALVKQRDHLRLYAQGCRRSGEHRKRIAEIQRELDAACLYLGPQAVPFPAEQDDLDFGEPDYAMELHHTEGAR